MSNPVSTYLEQEILSASNLQLVHILYQLAMNELREARRNLASKQIAAKCSNLSRACNFISELLGALDLKAGGEIAVRLKALYEYMLSRLLLANMRNQDEPVAEVLSLLATLDEGWKEIAAPKNEVAHHQSRSALPGAFGSADVDTPAQVWSF